MSNYSPGESFAPNLMAVGRKWQRQRSGARFSKNLMTNLRKTY